MEINFEKRKGKAKDMYKVGNVIKDITDTLYLVVGNNDHGYALVNLTDNNVVLVAQFYIFTDFMLALCFTLMGQKIKCGNKLLFYR